MRAGGIGIWDFDVERDTLTWDDQMFRLYGITAEQPGGAQEAWQSGVHSDDRERVDAEIAAALRGEKELATEFRVLWPDDTVRDIRALATVQRDVSGRPVRMIGTNWDITEQKRAQEALQESEALYRSILAASPEDITITDLDGRIRMISPVGIRLFGFGSEADAVGRSFDEFLVPDDRARAAANVASRSQGGAARSDEYRALRVDGSVFPIEVSGDLIRDADGQPTGAVFVGRDITERKLAEEALLLQAQKMETVGHLAGGIAHDFNNLLVVVAGNAELAHKDLPPDDPRIAEIEDATRRGAALTRQLLSFSRRQVVLPEVLDLNAVVGEIREMLRHVIGAEIELRFEPGKPLGAVRADGSRLGQVLMNLAVNARDAMPDGGIITIATRDVALAEEDLAHPVSLTPGRYVALSVTDTGTGMDAATRARLFEPFFTTKAPGSGTGLGLPSVLRIAEQSGGTVSVESEPGCGSTFTLYLPTTDDPILTPLIAPVAPIELGEPGGETILLVEDDPGVRRLTERILAVAGYTVLTARDEAAALAALAAHPAPIQLLLADLILPRIGGAELARRVAEARPGTRILLMSGYPGDILAGNGVLPADANLVEKPFTADELIAAVHRVLSGRGSQQLPSY